GAGGLSAARQIAVGDIPVRDAPNSYAVGDFNGDGKLDLIVKGMTNGLALLAGDGSGNFGETSTGIAADYPNPQFVAGDFDGDGALDLVVIPLAPAGDCFTPVKPPALLLGDGRGGFINPPTLARDGAALPLCVAGLKNGNGA